MPKFLITLPPMPEAEVKKTWAHVLKTHRTVGVKSMKMNQAYVDVETGRVSCCWDADNREQVVALFKRAGVLVESISAVDEVMEKDLV